VFLFGDEVRGRVGDDVGQGLWERAAGDER
jgi:hypothetical protein